MSKEYDVYNEVWVVITYGDTEFYKIYLNKKTAEKIAADNNKRAEKIVYYNSEHPKCEVKSLADAIDWIKDAMKDQYIDNQFHLNSY